MGLKGAKNWLALAWLYYLVLLRRIIHRLIVPATKSPAQPPLTNGVPHKDKNHSKDLWFSRPFPCLVCSDDETLSLILLIPSSDADCLFFFWTKHHLLKTKQSFVERFFPFNHYETISQKMNLHCNQTSSSLEIENPSALLLLLPSTSLFPECTS